MLAGMVPSKTFALMQGKTFTLIATKVQAHRFCLRTEWQVMGVLCGS